MSRLILRNGRRLTILGALAIIIAIAGVVGALAYWTASGTGTATASSGNLTPATISASLTSGSPVAITWTAQAAMTPASQNSNISYVVERKSGGSYAPISTGPCSIPLGYGTTQCNDTSVPSDGAYSYQVVAHFNSWSATSNEVSVNVDATPPYVLSIGRADPSPTNAGSVHWTVTFSESVTGVGGSDFALAAGGPAGAAITSVIGTGATYTVTASTGTGDGSLRLDLSDDNSINDPAGNPLGTSGGPGDGSFTGQTYTLDKTAPSVSSIDRAEANPTHATTVSWTVAISENVSGIDATDFTLTRGGALTGGAITGVTPVDASHYTVSATTGAGDGTLRLDLADDDSVSDGVGNRLGGTGAGNGNFTGQVYTVDKTAPTVTVEQKVGQVDPASTLPIRFTVQFSESVTDFDSSDVTLGGTATGGSAAVTGSGQNYEIAVSGLTGTGTVIASIAANRAQDAAGNSSSASTSGDNTVTYAPAGPSVTVEQKATQPDPANSLPIRFTVHFSASVSDFDATDVTRGGTATGGSAVVTGSGQDYEIAVSGLTSDGTVTASIAANRGHDTLGTGNSASTSIDNSVSYDATAPIVTLTKVNGAVVTFPFATNASVTSIAGACETVAGLVAWSVTGDATQSGTTTCTAGAWTQTLTTALSADGNYTLAASQTDAAGNAGSSGTKAVTVDKTRPVITATALANGNPYVANTWTNQNVTVTFSCAETGAVQTGLASNTVGGGGTQSAETSTGSFTNTGACADNAGNSALPNTFSPIKIDKTKPVISATALANGNPYVANTWTNQNVTVTFACADTGSVQSALASNTVGGGGTQSAETSTGSFTNTGACTDNAGNSADPNTFSAIKIDKTAPAGGTVDAAGLVGTGARYSNALALSIALAKGIDTGGSGVAATGATLWRAQGTLTSSDGLVDGTCSAYGAYAQVGAADPSSPAANTATDNACFRFQYRVFDTAGNLATYTSGDIKVETAAPASLAPALTYSAVSGNVYVDTSASPDTVYFIDATSRSGSFTVTASATDAFSGLTASTLPTTLTGWTITGTGNTRTFSYSGNGATPPASVNFTATDNATKVGTTSLNFANDSTLPIVAITSPANASTITDSTPVFAGDCDDYSGDTVTISVSQGATVIRTATDTCDPASGGSFSGSTVSPLLPDGTYTAQASQTRGGHVGLSPVITFTIDTTRPSVTIDQAVGQADPSNASTINFTAVFTEPVTGFAAADVTKSSGAVTVTGGPTTYNVAVTGMTNGNALTVSIAQNLASDAVGNLNTASTSTDNSVTYDATAPIVTLTKVNGATVTFPYFTNTASVTTVGGACGILARDNATVNWSVTGGSTQSGTATCAASAWSATLTTPLTAEAAYTLSATQSDTAGNNGVSGNQALTIDRIAPTVTINQAAAQTDPTGTSPINFTVVFSESTADFATGDVTFTGTAGGTKVGTVTGSGTTYNVAVTGMSLGTVVASLSAGVAHDATGNASAASTSTDNTVTFIDTTAPTVTNVQMTNSGTVGRVNTGDGLVITYSETMNATSFCPTWTNSGTQTFTGSAIFDSATSGADDTVGVTGCGGAFHLGTVTLNENYLLQSGSGDATAIFPSSTISWNPATNQLTIIFGGTVTFTGSSTVFSTSTLSTSVPTYTSAAPRETDLAGNSVGNGPFTGTNSRF